MVDVNHAYHSFTFLCTHLSSSDVFPGSTDAKLEFDTGHGKFKQRVWQWFNSLNSPAFESRENATSVSNVKSNIDYKLRNRYVGTVFYSAEIAGCVSLSQSHAAPCTVLIPLHD